MCVSEGVYVLSVLYLAALNSSNSCSLIHVREVIHLMMEPELFVWMHVCTEWEGIGRIHWAHCSSALVSQLHRCSEFSPSLLCACVCVCTCMRVCIILAGQIDKVLRMALKGRRVAELHARLFNTHKKKQMYSQPKRNYSHTTL